MLAKCCWNLAYSQVLKDALGFEDYSLLYVALYFMSRKVSAFKAQFHTVKLIPMLPQVLVPVCIDNF